MRIIILKMSLLEEVDYGVSDYGDWNQQPYRQIICVDPASRKNLGIRIERRYGDGRIDTIHFQLFDMTRPLEYQTIRPKGKRRTREEKEMDERLKEEQPEYPWKNLNIWMDSIWDRLRMSHIFLIERQLPMNYRAVRIQQHIISYMMCRLRLDTDLQYRMRMYEVNPKLKGQVLSAPRCREKELKVWAIQKSQELLIARGDQASVDYILSLKKQDDVADTVCHIEAYVQLTGVNGWRQPTFIPPVVTVTKKNKKTIETNEESIPIKKNAKKVDQKIFIDASVNETVAEDPVVKKRSRGTKHLTQSNAKSLGAQSSLSV